MTQLGYTWYPKDWWTSDTFFEWEDYPLVRYAYREILDLLYSQKGSVKITNKIIKSRFKITLTKEEYEILKTKFDITQDDFWSTDKVKTRTTKAEAARENGKKGGRPKKENNSEELKTQKPNKITQPNNPKNPPSERERESKREIESKSKRKEKEKNARAIDILKSEKQNELDVLWMQNHKQIDDKIKLVDSFNDKMDLELAQGKITFDAQELMPRFSGYVRQWISNANESKSNPKFNNAPEPNSWESGKLPRKN